VTRALLLLAIACGAAAHPAPDPVARSRAELKRLFADARAAAQDLYADGDPTDRAWVAHELVALAAFDQKLRDAMSWPARANASRLDREFYISNWNALLVMYDARNVAVLRRLVAVHGWFPADAWGAEVADAAWLLAQHADSDPYLQADVLAKLEPKGESYTLLFDRVAHARGKPQRYGTQGECGPAKTWTPFPTEDPAHLDERRVALGLSAMASYVAKVREQCN